MNLEFSEDQKFVQQTARDYLSEHAGLGSLALSDFDQAQFFTLTFEA